MSYKKDMSKYEHLEGWERCGFGEQLDKGEINGSCTGQIRRSIK